MARQIIKALELAGHEVEVLSRFKCRVKQPEMLADIEHKAADEVALISQGWDEGSPPDLILTYHVYYKSPDLIGAVLARRFGLPYVTLEASYAGKREKDDWRAAQAIAVGNIQQAKLNICFTQRDAQGVGQVVSQDRMAMLDPFIDVDGFAPESGIKRQAGGPVELVTVAMMAYGNKVNSYNMLSDCLKRVNQANWQLTIVGDGPARDEVESLFEGEPRVRFAGQMDKAGVAGYLARSDIFVWPGYREAFGLAYLEAQAMGVPVVAMESGGVGSVVEDQCTGFLVKEGDVDAMAERLDELIADPDQRARMGKAAHDFVHGRRSLAFAAGRLDGLLKEVAGK